MSEPATNQELLTHITYIRESMDEVKKDIKALAPTVAEHETRITVLEERTPARRTLWGAGGFFGGLLAGFLSSRSGG